MGDLVEVPFPPSNEEKTKQFVATYRETMGLPVIENVVSFREGMGDGVKFYRYRGEGRQFALTGSERIKDALLAAGANSFLPYRPVPEADEHYDVVLPSYLWSFM